MTLKFEFINHSCFILTNNNITLAVDPWLEGSVFNKSWELLVDTPKSSLGNVKNCDYIWFSHEHPDHFNPQDVKKFPTDKKYLFQKTKDKRVINFLKKFSKNVLELNSNQVFKLNKDFSIQVLPFQDLDSFCIIKINDLTILNLNDCDIKNSKELKFIKEKAGNIDILFAQFSYAIGKSNKEDKKTREEISKKILENLSRTISYLKPKKVVPFASFCFFSRKDNFYLNDSINKIGDTISFLKKKHLDVEFLCFYPGDIWDLNNEWKNEESLNKYIDHYKNIQPSNNIDDIIKFSELESISLKFISTTKKNNNLFDIYNFINKKYHSIFFKLTDSNIFLKFDFDKGLQKTFNITDENPICELTSESLKQLFIGGYGYDALTIGGRYEANKLGEKCLKKIFKFQTKNYQNQFYNFTDILQRLFSKIFKNSRAIPDR